MSNLTSNKYFNFGLIALAIVWVVVYSSITLTTKPRLWVDEAKSIELAESFADYGKLDIQTAPGKFSGIPQLLQSTGYPVTAPLALIFKIFGNSLVAARVFMLAWMIAALIGIYSLGRRIFGEKEAILAVFLTASFASFFDSGRTVVGEIPGFVFLTCGIYCCLLKKNYYLSGLFLGLAVVTKPSVFLAIAPAIFLAFIFEGRGFIGKILKTGIGMIPAAIGWILLVLGNPFVKSSWESILNFFKNPYSSDSVGGNMLSNFLGFFHSTTLIYFGILFLVVITARFFLNDQKLKSIYNFAIIYGALAFVYYLRSPGWLRYIVVAELLILFLLPEALRIIADKIPKIGGCAVRLVATGAVFLIAVQTFHLFTAAQIYTSDTAIKTADYLNEKFSGKSIGVMNSLGVSILLDADKKYQIVEMAGIPVIGENPLSANPLPEVIVSVIGDKFLEQGRPVLEKKYRLTDNFDGYDIYTLAGF
ncbi:MAG: glycosyltransferase family 39 protein [Candidatus Pacebacteria bacterium]|nr:glycosyltransferase family 39 protein [Candidatus Paceibacterota bacterium]